MFYYTLLFQYSTYKNYNFYREFVIFLVYNAVVSYTDKLRLKLKY